MDILNQAIKNGNALFLTLKSNPKAMSVRHYIPFLFFLSILVMPALSFVLPLFFWCFMAELTLYGLLDFYFSFFKGSIKKAWLKFLMYPLFHFVYGLGSFLGLIGVRLY